MRMRNLNLLGFYHTFQSEKLKLQETIVRIFETKKQQLSGRNHQTLAILYIVSKTTASTP